MKPIDRVLDRTRNRRENGSGWVVSCPVPGHGKGRGDLNPSLSVSEGVGGRALLNCFAGCSPEAIASAMGLTLADLFEYLDDRRWAGGSIPSDGSRFLDTGCTLADYARAKGLPADFLAKEARLRDVHYVEGPAVRMPYLDEGGEEVCVRFRVSLDGKPKVRTRKGDRHTIYGLWRMDRIREAGWAVLAEGESDAHTLWRHGFPALGVPGAGSWKAEWSEKFEGIERVYVVVEDEAGEGLWEKLAASPLQERLYRVELGYLGAKDPSELHLAEPGQFAERFEDALAKATSFMDIAETEAQERAREAWSKSADLATEPDILERFRIDLKACGVAGESRTAEILYLALNSRHLPAKQLVNVVVKGPSSAGKSYMVESVLDFFPEDSYHSLTAMSERALAYSEVPLSHRFLVLAEEAGMSGDFQTYLIRSLLSEGRLRYETVEKTSEGLKRLV